MFASITTLLSDYLASKGIEYQFSSVLVLTVKVCQYQFLDC